MQLSSYEHNDALHFDGRRDEYLKSVGVFSSNSILSLALRNNLLKSHSWHHHPTLTEDKLRSEYPLCDVMFLTPEEQ